DERTFPDGTGHGLTLLLRVTRPDDELVGRFVVTGAGTLGRLAPGGNRVTAARGPAFATAVRVVDRVLGDAAGQRALAEPPLPAGDHLVARREALRRQDIGLLTGLVSHESDERRPVGIVLEPLDGCRNIPGAPLEVDGAVLLLVTASDSAAGHVALVVTTARL